MLTLIKLFEISIVASNCLGFARSRRMALSFLLFFAFNRSISDGESEKKAVSDPDINPEKKSNTKIANKAMNVSAENPKKN